MTTFLLPLPVEGTNSWQQEGMHSYLHRLAAVHGVSITQLIQILNHWHVKNGFRHLVVSKSLVFSNKGSRLFGYSSAMQTLVRSLERATGMQNLGRCTLLPIADVLAAQCSFTVRSSREWCPACLEEDIRNDCQPYDRIAWILTPVRRCHVHKLLLRHKCPTCHSGQPYAHRSGDMRLCCHCGALIINDISQDEVALKPSFGEHDCVLLIEALSQGVLSHVVPNASVVFEDRLELVDRRLACAVRRISDCGKRKGIIRPTLRTLLRKAHITGCSVVSIMTEPEMAADSAAQCIIDVSMLPKISRPKNSSEIAIYVRNTLLSLMDAPQQDGLPSLHEICQRMGVSQGYVRHRFPEIVKRWQGLRAGQISALSEQQLHACRDEIERLRASGISFATHKELEQHMVTSTGCSISFARRAMENRPVHPDHKLIDRSLLLRRF